MKNFTKKAPVSGKQLILFPGSYYLVYKSKVIDSVCQFVPQERCCIAPLKKSKLTRRLDGGIGKVGIRGESFIFSI
jgi:hypothetical protein